jgi:hypothetical protein
MPRLQKVEMISVQLMEPGPFLDLDLAKDTKRPAVLCCKQTLPRKMESPPPCKHGLYFSPIFFETLFNCIAQLEMMDRYSWDTTHASLRKKLNNGQSRQAS